MFYLPYKFKSQNEPTTPRGPNFSRASVVKTLIDGTKISLKLPRHKTIRKVDHLTPKNTIDLIDSGFQFINKKNSSWKSYDLFSRHWDFNGHNFVGKVGVLSVLGSLLKLEKHPIGTSFFHPVFFENSISDYLTDFYSEHRDRYDKNDPYKWYYTAPVDWKIMGFNGDLQGVRFKVSDSTDNMSRDQQFYIFVPISGSYIFRCSFMMERNLNLSEEFTIDEWINPMPFIELREQIIGSIKVELSEDAKKQRELALQGVANPKLSETFAPIDWPKDGVLKEKFDIENDDGWGEYS